MHCPSVQKSFSFTHAHCALGTPILDGCSQVRAPDASIVCLSKFGLSLPSPRRILWSGLHCSARVDGALQRVATGFCLADFGPGRMPYSWLAEPRTFVLAVTRTMHVQRSTPTLRAMPEPFRDPMAISLVSALLLPTKRQLSWDSFPPLPVWQLRSSFACLLVVIAIHVYMQSLSLLSECPHGFSRQKCTQRGRLRTGHFALLH